ncbi:methyltransferase domain-containing protein [Tricladium varicosporioides]|nr:methyltransferase domain-containing protein [Hymenoscyphus varicosporioides]
MPPQKRLPYPVAFSSEEEYVSSLLRFSSENKLFQTLVGGVHILDFFTRDPSLFSTVIPPEWQEWLLKADSMRILDLCMRDDLNSAGERDGDKKPPESLVDYIKEIRRHSLVREFNAPESGNSTIDENGTLKKFQPKLPRQVSVGMIPKKIHEVANFASYVAKISEYVKSPSGHSITHFVDFGSGQNYLGRTLACPPYNKHIVAVESKEGNISGAKRMDVFAGVGEREKVWRNKKRVVRNIVKNGVGKDSEVGSEAKNVDERTIDLRPIRELATIYTPEEGKGYMQYVEHRVQDSDLSDVVEQIKKIRIVVPNGDVQVVKTSEGKNPELGEVLKGMEDENEVRLMAISIHSCGNLSHHGIRSLILNPAVQAIAIVGCCYNLLSSRLGPATLKHPLMRRNMRAINAPADEKALPENDQHGFPMSERLATYGDEGVRLNITARMMGVQAPQNWTAKESDSFFTRHFYRALLQKVFLDYGVVSKIAEDEGGPESTQPIIIGSLRKSCYGSFREYVRGAMEKLKADPARTVPLGEQMENITDTEIEEYAEKYEIRKKELSTTWSLMAFSAGVVESLIVVDRWLFLKEHEELVKDCWVEPVFEYKQSPRNLVVVGIKR